MADRVFGPRVTGFNFMGLHIGATEEVFRDDTGGSKVPGSLSVVITSPLGSSATIAPVANGASASIKATPTVNVTGTIDDCNTEPPQGQTPEMFVFKVTLRAQGTVKIGPFPFPLKAQIDAFTVHVPTDAAVHAQVLDAHSASPA